MKDGFTFIDDNEYDNYFAGDINGDDIVNVQDVVILVGYVLGNLDLTDEQKEIADINQDGIINVLDVVQLVNMITQTQASLDETGDRLQVNNNFNQIFRQRQVEKGFLTNLRDELITTSAVSLTGSTSLGIASEVSSSLRNFITASAGFLQSGSRLTSIRSPHRKRIKPHW